MHQDSSQPAAPADHPVRIATSLTERDRVYRFRYGNFAIEHGRWPNPQLVARRMIHDLADEQATLFFVEVEGRVVATLRLRIGHLPDELHGPFNTKQFAAAAGSSVALADEIFVSRTFVSRIFRKPSLLELILETASARCEENGILLLFCHARPEAVPAFRAAGFEEVGAPFEHPDLGSRVPLVRFLGAETHPGRAP